MVLTDDTATVGGIFMIFSADTHEISILIKWWKNQPSSMSASACTQTLHYLNSGFWPKCELFFLSTLFFFLWAHQHETFRYQSALLREHLSQKITLDHTYNPIFWPKTSFLGYKIPPNLFSFFCQKADLTSGQDMQNPKNRFKKIFFLLRATRAWRS